jgi:hypothetical protein
MKAGSGRSDLQVESGVVRRLKTGASAASYQINSANERTSGGSFSQPILPGFI